jgi:hypothetical protein
MQPSNDEPSPQAAKTQKAREKAESRYPQETWREIEERIFIAEGREPKGKNQQRVLEKELVQARILTAQGSTVYLLPERTSPATIGVKHPDAVVDGFIMEFKTISGSINQIEHRFKESMKKAEGVFFKIDAGLSKAEVFRKIRLVSFQKQYRKGVIIAYFTKTAELHYWDIAEL